MDFLDRAYQKFEEVAPQIMEELVKFQEKTEQRQQKIEEYKAEYSMLSNKELMEKLDRETSSERRKAIISVKKERGLKISRYKEEYSNLNINELMFEKRRLELNNKGDADLRIIAINSLLKERSLCKD